MPSRIRKHLVLIETVGNQRFIFDTNKLRDNVGASQLLYRAGTDWVQDAVKGKDAEAVFLASGKALLRVRDRETGRAIMSAVTRRALIEAPGLTVRGVISEAPVSFDTAVDVHKALTALIDRHKALASTLPGPEGRFAALPVLQPCARSGLPAEEWFAISKGEPPEALSAVSLNKQCHRDIGWNRIINMINDCGGETSLSSMFHKNVTEMEEAIQDMDFVALIHADGNGLGQIFLNFHQYSGLSGQEYCDHYGAFSKALDGCTLRAFRKALDALSQRRGHAGKLPVAPLVLGGDDLTVLCDGRHALRLTADFLTFFAQETAACDEVAAITKTAHNGVAGLGACAGVALVKPHFPFHAAYGLAEALIKNAKAGKTRFGGRPYTALDFHILYDSADADLDRIRSHAVARDKSSRLTAKPYVVTMPTAGVQKEALAWAEHRRWSWLDRVQQALPGPRDEDGARLPNSALHALREAAHEGKTLADARLRATLGREKQDAPDRVKAAWSTLLGSTDDDASLFIETPDGPVTRLLDALDTVGFWK